MKANLNSQLKIGRYTRRNLPETWKNIKRWILMRKWRLNLRDLPSNPNKSFRKRKDRNKSFNNRHFFKINGLLNTQHIKWKIKKDSQQDTTLQYFRIQRIRSFYRVLKQTNKKSYGIKVIEFFWPQQQKLKDI